MILIVLEQFNLCAVGISISARKWRAASIRRGWMALRNSACPRKSMAGASFPKASPCQSVQRWRRSVLPHLAVSKGATLATISFDYPFFGYHDVTVCYHNAGWTIGETKLERANTENNMIPAMQVVLEREGGLKADLRYSTVDESGVWLGVTGKRSPYDEKGNRLQEGNVAARLTHRLRQMPYANEAYDEAINYRIQILAAARGGLGSEQEQQLENLFQKARLLIAARFIAPAATPTPTRAPCRLTNRYPIALPMPRVEHSRRPRSGWQRARHPSPIPRARPSKKRRNPSMQTRHPVADPTKKAIENAIKDASESKEK
jgi:hypothetical protein